MHQNKPKILDNVIGIGGFAGVGKSTLIGKFFRRGYPVSYEFNESSVNPILQLLFQKYMENKTDAFMMQIAFLNHTIERYTTIVKQARDKKPVFVDRTIIEDIYFARGQILDKELLKLYDDIWSDTIEEFAENIGFPSIYFHIDLPFDIAFLRAIERDPSEKAEKTRNKARFEEIFRQYKENMKKSILSWGIEYIQIDARDLTKQEVFEKCHQILLDKKIINKIIE